MLCVACAFAFVCGRAAAQETAGFPARPVQIIVPYSTGTSSDILARLLGPKLSERWKVSVVADNRPGATGAVGMAYVAKAAPDGHTLMFVPTSFSMMPALHPQLAFDPVKSFSPVAVLVTSGLALAVHPQLPVRSVREFIQLAKRRPGEIYYASAGNGSAQHLAMELFNIEAGIRIVHIPYKGLASALTDVMGGHVQATISTYQTIRPYVTGGRLRMLAVTTPERSPLFSEIPTFKEQGLGRVDVESWQGALVPAATPAATIARLNADILALLRLPDIREQLARQGMSAAGSTPEQFGDLIRSELARWARVVAVAKIKMD